MTLLIILRRQTKFSPSSRRRELGILTVPFRPFFKPTTEEMYLHLQAEHSESLAIEERDWKMELFGIDLNKNQQQ